MKQIPTLRARRRGSDLILHCPFCHVEHVHGGADMDMPTHRAAQCFPFSGSPYLRGGYFLTLEEIDCAEDVQTRTRLERVAGGSI
jgi:hypothetical protein